MRHVHRGPDHITRVGVEFLEKQAPDRLVGTSTGIKRPVFSSVRSSQSAPVAAPRPFVASFSISRPAFTPPRVSAPPRPAPPPPSPVPPPPPARPLEEVLEEIGRARGSARELIAEARIWEALDCLARAQALANGTPEEQDIRILAWETQAKVPSLIRAAQQNLEEFARQEPTMVATHSALGRVYREAGLAARARAAFKQVLALDPSNREAAGAMKALSDPARRG